MLTYKDAGVDIDEGNKAVKLIKNKVKDTYDSNVIGDLGSFSGMYSLKEFMNMKHPVLLSSTDGVGTKLKIAHLMNKHDTIGIDLVAMCVNDLICQGAKPLFFLDYIAVGNLNAQIVDKVVHGIVNGCKMARCSLVGGETAEMPGMYDFGEYDVAGFSVGICDMNKIIDGKNVQPKDVLIGIESSGIHSNGYSLIRKIFLEKLKYKLDDYIDELGMTLGDALIVPTKIYVDTALNLVDKYDIKSISHITGGGLMENVTRAIPKGLGIKIDTLSWDKPKIFKMIENLDVVSKKELYRSFNMGIGLVLVVSKEDADNIISEINKTDRAFIIGEVVDDEGVTLC